MSNYYDKAIMRAQKRAAATGEKRWVVYHEELARPEYHGQPGNYWAICCDRVVERMQSLGCRVEGFALPGGEFFTTLAHDRAMREAAA